MESKIKNRHDSREGWCKALKTALEPHFAKHGYPLPDKIRYAIAFTSHGRKGKTAGQALPPAASADGHYEVIVKCDRDDPIEVAGVVIHQLVHVVTGKDHNPRFREACLKLGMDVSEGLKKAMPGKVLREERLNDIVASLGPLPHGRVDLDALHLAADRPRKQSTRMLLAKCQAENCPFNVRLSRMCLDIGVPGCPKHGPMAADDAPADLPQAAE